MPYAPRPTTVLPTTRQPSTNSTTSQQSSALASRITAKRRELENLKQLRDLSGALAGQMGLLEEKLATLRDGTEAVACVLANWDNVLRAISMASTKVPKQVTTSNGEGDEEEEEQQQQSARQEKVENGGEAQPLPVTLVRIPTEPGDPRQRHVEPNEPSS